MEALYRSEIELLMEGGDHARARTLIDRDLVRGVAERADAERVLSDLLERRPDVKIRIGDRSYFGSGVTGDVPCFEVEIVPRLVAAGG